MSENKAFRDAAALAVVMWLLVAPFKGRDFNAGGYSLARFDTQEQCAKREAEVRKPGFKLADASAADFARATCKSYFTPDLCYSCLRK